MNYINKKNIAKLISLITLVGVLSTITYLAAYKIGEEYFFDKLFYYKSVSHGYWLADKKVDLVDFGKRSRDVLKLEDDWNHFQSNNVLGISDDKNTYNIALIGDSYVWGQGLTYEKTLPYVLEKKLNKKISANVISLAVSGDSILEFWQNYYKSSNLYDIDLFIFVPVENDLMFSRKYPNEKANIPFWEDCEQKTPEDQMSYDLHYTENTNENFDKRLKESWSNPFHLCLLEEFLIRIPKENSIFFITHENHFNLKEESYYSEGVFAWTNYINFLNKHNHNLIFATETRTDPEYSEFWKDKQNFRISKKETHPSETAIEIYSDVISREIFEKYY